MIIQIISKPNSKKEYITQLDDNKFIVSVKEKAVEGQANKKIIKVLSKHFKIPKSKIKIVKGDKFKIKHILIEDSYFN